MKEKAAERRTEKWWKRDGWWREWSEKGKRGKEDGTWESGLFRPLLTLPETQRKECGLFLGPALRFSLTLCVPLNTAAEGFKEELMNTLEWKHGSKIYRPRFEITHAAKLSLGDRFCRKPWKDNKASFQEFTKKFTWLPNYHVQASGCYNHGTEKKIL